MTQRYVTAKGTHRRRRYFRRSDELRGWWPWGLLPLIGLLLVFGYGAVRIAPHIETEVQSEVTSRLAAAGVEVSGIHVDGQHVTVRATATGNETNTIRALAASAECDTWVGRIGCPTRIALTLNDPIPTPPNSRRTAQRTGAAVADSQRAHNFDFGIAGRTISLAGEVPTHTERQRIAELAALGDFRVVDELTVSMATATEAYGLAANRALDVLKGFEHGHVTWTAGVLDARGSVASAAHADIARQTFSAGAKSPRLGRIQLEIMEDLERCNKQFDELLSASTIRFRTASAEIDRGNEPVLERLAELALQCPGALTIAGHTDSRGAPEMNRELSLGRAMAVRDALVALGVDGTRLSVHGAGASSPIASNETRAGRARNRRIVVTVDGLNQRENPP